jgi:hypothetical protein
MLAIGFCWYSLWSWWSSPLFLDCWVLFKKSWMSICQIFSASIDVIMWHFYLTCWCYILLTDFQMLNQFCINSSWSWSINLLNIVVFNLLIFCWGFLYRFMRDISHQSSPSYVFVWSWHWGNASLISMIRSIPSASTFWKCRVSIILP